MRVTAIAMGIGALMLASADIVSAQGLNGTYRGMLECAKLPFNKGPQRIAFELKVSGGTATYVRTMRNADNTADVGKEEGSGQVAADGATTLTGGWKGTRDSYTASYTGKLTKAGGKLGGRQNWQYDGKSYTRDCSITLKQS